MEGRSEPQTVGLQGRFLKCAGIARDVRVAYCMQPTACSVTLAGVQRNIWRYDHRFTKLCLGKKALWLSPQFPNVAFRNIERQTLLL